MSVDTKKASLYSAPHPLAQQLNHLASWGPLDMALVDIYFGIAGSYRSTILSHEAA